MSNLSKTIQKLVQNILYIINNNKHISKQILVDFRIMQQLEQIKQQNLSKHITYVQSALYQKYSSSQIYYYTNKINQIVKEKRTHCNIVYEDIEYICDSQQYMKRWYHGKQYNNKMFTFKEYYFYHQDCPRIFTKGIQQPYTKWQDKKRDLVYKKLKLIYNEDLQSQTDLNGSKSKQVYSPIQHFLLDVSQYNPYSKKYYLRVEARKEKQLAEKKQREFQNKSKIELSRLNHDLSTMLGQINDLSQQLSRLIQTPKKQQYLTKNISNFRKSEELNTVPNTESVFQFNFKKQKANSIHKLSNNDFKTIQKPKKNSLHQYQSKQLHRETFMQIGKLSPKFNSNLFNRNNNIKSQSIFSVSSFATQNKKQQLKLISKKQPLKINQPKVQYQSEKPNGIMKSQSIENKLNNRRQLGKIKGKQISQEKAKTKINEFSDKKFSQSLSKLRIYKSQFEGPSSTLKKPMFKIRSNQNEKQYNKKGLLIKNY